MSSHPHRQSDPEGIKILPGIVPVIGSTESEARKLDQQLEDLIKPEYARAQLAKTLRVSAVLPSGLEAFVDHVVPVLRARGLFRTEYAGNTLREHYGLARPLNRYSGALAAAGASGA